MTYAKIFGILSGNRSLARIRRTWHYLLRGPAPGEEKLLAALADSVRAIAPPGFDVTQAKGTIRVTGRGTHAGQMKVLMPFFIWRTDDTVEERLRHVLDTHSAALEQFFTVALRASWPSDNAPRHVRVDGATAVAWWGLGDGPDHAIRVLGPIYRSELGV